jgi:transcriptional regulator with XRE-family HTH domain
VLWVQEPAGVRLRADMDDRDRSLGDRIRDARVAQGLALRELARRIEKAPSYLSDIEYDRRTPSEDVLRAICSELALDFDTMLGLAGRLGNEADRYLKRHPTAGVLFRKVSAAGLQEDDLQNLVTRVDELAKQRRKGK